jgi:hypothetical protein
MARVWLDSPNMSTFETNCDLNTIVIKFNGKVYHGRREALFGISSDGKRTFWIDRAKGEVS